MKLIDQFEDEKYWYIVLELMEGGDLFEQIRRRGSFDEKKAREMIRVLIDAVRYCHLKGIWHRDIKLENLLLSCKNVDHACLKLADFGLAIQMERENMKATDCCGTAEYVAPEVLQSQPYGKECDFWSIGIVAYFLLCGFAPF